MESVSQLRHSARTTLAKTATDTAIMMTSIAVSRDENMLPLQLPCAQRCSVRAALRASGPKPLQLIVARRGPSGRRPPRRRRSGLDATAVVQRGELSCFGIFYHYPSVNPENWDPPSIAAKVKNTDVGSTCDCDELLVAAGLAHPALRFAGKNAAVAYEGFPLDGVGSPKTLVVDGVPYDLED